MADAEQVEGAALDGVGVVTSRKPGRAGSAGAMVFRQMVARSVSRLAKLCTGTGPQRCAWRPP